MIRNPIGQTLLNQFRIDAFIAAGGMGAVYRVWDLKRNVPLAMKVLHADLAEDPSVFKRFQREANALKKLAHPNIVPFYGLYQSHGMAFLLERFVDGPSLKDILKERSGKPLPTEEALVYLKAISAALGYAHAHGVVHCDVKPGNVMVDQGGNIYLTDFGVARHAESTTTTLATAGTAAYMAPEQIRGDPVSPATDVYALGVILFEMLTGRRLFRGDEIGTLSEDSTGSERIRHAQLNVPPPDPRQFNPAIPEGLAQVLLKALDKNPAQRYASTQELFIKVVYAASMKPEQIPDRAITSLPPLGWEGCDGPMPPGAGGDKGRRGTSGLFIIGGIGVVVLFILIWAIRQVPPADGTPTPTRRITETESQTDTPLPQTPTETAIPTLTRTPRLPPTPTLIPTMINDPAVSCPGTSHLRNGMDAYVSRPAKIYNIPRYQFGDRAPNPPTILAELNVGDRVKLVTEQEQFDSPKCYLKSYFWKVSVETGPWKGIKGWVFEFYKHDSRDKDEFVSSFVEGYYLCPYPPELRICPP